MTAMTKVRSVRELYPPQPTPEWLPWLRGLVTNDRDDSGKFVLPRSLRPNEREAIERRQKALGPWLAAGNRRDIEQSINLMQNGFAGGRNSEAEEYVTLSAYVNAVADLPFWAVERACTRFGRNEVRDSELGKDQTWNRTWGPSTAHLRCIAIAMLQPFAEESTRLWMTLRGTVRIEVSEAERKVVGEKMTAFVDELERNSEAMETERRADIFARMRTDNRNAILDQYRDSGVEPPPHQGTPSSLSLLLSVGWSIQDGPNGKVLVAPAGYKPQPKDVQTKPQREPSAKSVGAIAKDKGLVQ